MADLKITDLSTISDVASDDLLEIVDISAASSRKVAREALAGWYFLTSPLTSTAWDGDAFSTTAKTLIDLSAVFGVPARIKAVMCNVAIKDSASEANDCFLCLSPNANASSGPKVACSGLANSKYGRGTVVVPCNANGDIYYQVSASGSGTANIYLEIWGYWL